MRMYSAIGNEVDFTLVIVEADKVDQDIVHGIYRRIYNVDEENVMAIVTLSDETIYTRV